MKAVAAPRPQTPPTSQRTAIVLKAFEAALKLFNRGHFAEARDAFEKVLEKCSDQVDVAARVTMYLAVCRARTQSAPKLPASADALYDQGVVEFNRANYTAALQLFERSLKTKPDTSHVLYSLAAAQARLGRSDDALRSLERAVSVRELHRSKARSDSDFSALRTDARFRELVGGFYDNESF